MPVWLVTGGSGFLGRQVLAALAGRADVWALGRRRPAGWAAGRFAEADLEQPEGVTRAVREVKPDVVIHASGKTPPADPDAFYRANTLATVHLLDALRSAGRVVRVVLAGSAAELGPVAVEALPVGEDHRCRPANAYALSKWLATCAGLAAGPPLEVAVARVFNPVGPGQPGDQAFGRFVAALVNPVGGPIVAGDLDARRDFVDVRDVARALVALAERGRPGLVYNVGTGRSRRVGDGLDHLIRRSGRAVEVRTDPAWTGPPGPRDSRADIDRITAHTGWRPGLTWEQSLDDLWDAAARGGVGSSV